MGRKTRKWLKCVFSGFKACDSAWLIRESSQEALVCTIPSSPLSTPSFNRSFLGLSSPLLHSLPLIYDFRLSHLDKQFSMKNKFHAKDIRSLQSTHMVKVHMGAYTWTHKITLLYVKTVHSETALFVFHSVLHHNSTCSCSDYKLQVWCIT